MKRLIVWCCCLVTSGIASAQKPQLELKKGDCIAICGNTLADRMQHDGWLETNLQLRFPDLQLKVRNLGFSGDTIDVRLRSMGFGTPDDHLNRVKADVIYMMFGFNESFAGPAGLDDFRKKYDAEVQRMLKQKYNGETAPRIVLVSPIAHENLSNPDLPNGTANNVNLEMYTQAIAQVARDHQLPFVDLYTATATGYDAIQEPLTINGIHLNSTGNKFVASVLNRSLFGEVSKGTELGREDVRQAVLQKDFYWFEFYRATDGYSIFGDRGNLQFVNGQTNREVMTRELEIIVQMTDNRDPVIWAAANNRIAAADDSNLLPFLPVITNKPGEGPNGAHRFLSGEEAIKKMRVLDGFEVNLFASEEMFPEFVNPVQMAFDPKGRLWVAVWPSYPHWKPKDEMNDKLLILEDTNGDGRADVCKTFADNLHNPTGFEFYNGGVLIAQAPDIMFLKDTNGDDKVDVRQRIVHGVDSADTHHASNSFVMGQDGAFYFQEGVFHHTQIESPYGLVRCVNAGSFRFEPRTFRVDVYTAYGYANPHGHAFDRWGRDIIHDGTGSNPYDCALISGHLAHPHKHNRAPQVYQQRTRPCPATEFVSGENFPKEMQDELLVENVIGDLGILRYKISDDGASMSGAEQKPLLLSDDPNFRPVDLEFAPDGSLHFIDWQNPIIGHMQHNLRDPSRDRVHGRAYRLVNTNAPLLKVKPASELTTPELLERLCTASAREKYRARLELSARPTDQIVAAINSHLPKCSTDDSKMEMLWVHQQINVTNQRLLDELLKAKTDWVRAAATRVLNYWIGKVDNAAEKLAEVASDPSPRVRLMAARGASFLPGSEGLKPLAIVASFPTDQFLDYMIRESMRSVDPGWKNKIAELSWISELRPQGLRFILDSIPAPELKNIPLNPSLAHYLIYRAQVGDAQRKDAIAFLANHEKSSTANILTTALKNVEKETNDRSVVYDLVRLLAQETPTALAAERDRLLDMSQSASLSIMRQVGWIGTILADNSPDKAWAEATKSLRGLTDISAALALVPDPVLQADLYPLVAQLATKVPENLIKGNGNQKANGLARYVRIELPGEQRTLTLAEVEVISGDENIARRGTAKQSSTSHGGSADRAIDGDSNPAYAAGKQTHTAESSKNPWWELDLQSTFAIDKIRIFNRQESFAGRLEGFSLSVLDENRQPLFQKTEIPAPETSVEIDTGLADVATTIRRAAIDSISQVRGKEGDSFGRLARLILENDLSSIAVRSIQRIPARLWNAELADDLGNAAVKRLVAMDESQRSSDTAAELIQLGQTAASLLPEEAATPLRKQLSKLGVEVLRIGTKPHRMAFDKSILVVEAGKPVVVIFENTDMMPHNFVLANPGTMEEIGQQAEAESLNADAMGRAFVPQNKNVLAKSNLLQPQQTEKIAFTAPSKPGIYPYVCTYPGHWRRMFGALYVVQSKDEYAVNPAEYVNVNGLRIQDPLLAMTVSQTEWTTNDFAEAMNEFQKGRDFAAGRQMFTAANCIACHKMNGQGREFGPDLLKLDPKWDATEILVHLIEPSKKIDDKYKTQTFLLASGKTISGIVMEEDEKVVKLVENPMVKTDIVEVDKRDIEDRNASDISIMPKGLLDTLTVDEVLNLLAYVTTKGDESAPIFKVQQK